MAVQAPNLQTRATSGAEAMSTTPGHWHLHIPDDPSGQYQLAQLDDYGELPRSQFQWRSPLCLELRARVSDVDVPLAIHDTHPAQGFLAATFASHRIPPWLLIAGVPALPLLAWPVTARWLRRLARIFIAEDAAQLAIDPTEWHNYRLEWHNDTVHFAVDNAICFTTNIAPRSPLGLVLWIDNQYAAFPPDGKLRFGTLANEPAWLELENITVQKEGVQ